jgi:hypothetical protein
MCGDGLVNTETDGYWEESLPCLLKKEELKNILMHMKQTITAFQIKAYTFWWGGGGKYD